MTTAIKIDQKYIERMYDMQVWCSENIGPGSHRGVSNTWLGTDDWYSYQEDYTEENLEDDDFPEPDLIFVFRREADATMFGLKWS